MNKAELVQEVAGKVGLTKKETNNVVDAITSAIADCLERNERVTLVGFGMFEMRRRKARTEVRLYLLLIISIDETKKTGKLEKRDIEKCLGYSPTVKELEKILHTFRELNLAEIEYSKEKSEIKFTLRRKGPGRK